MLNFDNFIVAKVPYNVVKQRKSCFNYRSYRTTCRPAYEYVN